VRRPKAADRRSREISNTSGTTLLEPFVFEISRDLPPRVARRGESSPRQPSSSALSLSADQRRGSA
jgi:hypothetical protein